MRLAVVGSRGFDHYSFAEFVLDEFRETSPTPLVIVSGGARGADLMASLYATRNELEYVVHLPMWDKHGKSAGYIRNVDIVNDCDELVAFWDGKSKGTLHSINTAKKQGKTVTVIRYDQINLE